jgi:hypothetical protein
MDASVVQNVLAERQKAGYHVDNRLLTEVERSDGEQFLIRLEDEDSFLSLIWQESDPARLLTPPGQPRTLRDVARRMIERGYTFEALNRDLGRSRAEHHPEWFEPCVHINRSFDYAKFGWVAVVAANDGERSQSPRGTFYIFDGVHKTLVLAARLLRGETCYQAVEALYLVPRRG